MAIHQCLAVAEVYDSTRHAVETQADKASYLLSKIKRDVWVSISASRGDEGRAISRLQQILDMPHLVCRLRMPLFHCHKQGNILHRPSIENNNFPRDVDRGPRRAAKYLLLWLQCGSEGPWTLETGRPWGGPL